MSKEDLKKMLSDVKGQAFNRLWILSGFMEYNDSINTHTLNLEVIPELSLGDSIVETKVAQHFNTAIAQKILPEEVFDLGEEGWKFHLVEKNNHTVIWHLDLDQVNGLPFKCIITLHDTDELFNTKK